MFPPSAEHPAHFAGPEGRGHRLRHIPGERKPGLLLANRHGCFSLVVVGDAAVVAAAVVVCRCWGLRFIDFAPQS